MRTNLSNGYREEVCAECGSPDLLVTNPNGERDQPEKSCMDCEASGYKVYDTHGLNDWDIRYCGSLGLHVVTEERDEVLQGRLKFHDYNDIGTPTKVTKL